MNVFSKRNIILPGPNGEKLRLKKDEGVGLPVWAEKSAYLKALEKDGKVILSAGGKKKPGKTPEPPAEDQNETADVPAE